MASIDAAGGNSARSSSTSHSSASDGPAGAHRSSSSTRPDDDGSSVRSQAADVRREALSAVISSPQDILVRDTAVRTVEAEARVARETLSPSMAERHLQDLEFEYHYEPAARVLLAEADMGVDPAAPAHGVDYFGGAAPQVIAQLVDLPSVPQALSSTDLNAKAEDVCEAVHHGAALTTLAGAVEGLTPADRARLVAETLKCDWRLTAGQLAGALDGGAISQQQYEAIANGFVDASNSGLLDPGTSARFLGIDANSGDPEIIADGARLLNTAADQPTEAFVRNFGHAMLTGAVLGSGQYSAVDGWARLASLTTNQAAIAETYASFDVADRQGILNTLGLSWYSDGGSMPTNDGLSIVIDAVASQQGPSPVAGETYGDLAVQITRFFGASPDIFFEDGVTPVDARAEAMADLFIGNHEAILRELSDPQLLVDKPGGSDYEPLAAADVTTLGNLTRLTMFNPGLSEAKAGEMRGQVIDYMNTMYSYPMGLDPEGVPALGRMGVILAGMQDGAKLGYEAMEDNRAAQERVVGFFTDLGIGAAKSGITRAGPQGLVLSELTKANTNLASGQVAGFVRTAVTDLLFGDYDTVEQDSIQIAVNQLAHEYVSSLDNGDRQGIISGYVDQFARALDDRRSN